MAHTLNAFPDLLISEDGIKIKLDHVIYTENNTAQTKDYPISDTTVDNISTAILISNDEFTLRIGFGRVFNIIGEREESRIRKIRDFIFKKKKKCTLILYDAIVTNVWVTNVSQAHGNEEAVFIDVNFKKLSVLSAGENQDQNTRNFVIEGKKGTLLLKKVVPIVTDYLQALA